MTDEKTCKKTNVDSDTEGNFVAIDLHRVDDLMTDIISAWQSKRIEGQGCLILDACNACNADDLHQLILVWPEEVMAMAMHQLSRATTFMDRLFGENSEELLRMIDQLKEIRQERKEKEKAESEEAGNLKENMDRLLHKFRSAVH